jgi:galactokinase
VNEDLEFKADQKWANFPIGVLAFLKEEGYPLSGADVLFSSTLPDGAGVSSSAAIEVLTTYMFMVENGKVDPDRVWISTFAQRVENKFIGVNCGIMDQFSVANGRANHGILLNCSNLEHSFIPLELVEYRLVILNTNKRRELAESKYNERRAECDQALELLQSEGPFADLCSANLEAIEKRISDPVLKARAKHVVSENGRVLEACAVLKEGNLHRFGQLLNESHFSLRDDYEVTGKELDSITEAARNHPACLGARMTGAGFGGCGIALVKSDQLDAFISEVGTVYSKETGLKADFYVSEIGEGVSRIS